MNRREHLFTIVAEEACEVAHRACKMLRFGPDEKQPGQGFTNSEQFMFEFVQLTAVVEMLIKEKHISDPKSGPSLEGLTTEKRERVEEYLLYSKKCGTLTP